MIALVARTIWLAALAPWNAQLSSHADLGVGDPAPPLTVYQWVKGDPVLAFDPGQVYVVEFWATWSRPCKDSIALLTELAKKFTNVIFCGVSVSETGGQAQVSTDSAYLPAVRKFVQDRSRDIGYRVGVDDPTGLMYRAWLRASGRETIPSVFVIDEDGKIAWIGNPMGGLSEALQRVTSPSAIAATIVEPDVEVTHRKIRKTRTQLLAPVVSLIERKHYKEAVSSLDVLIALEPDQLLYLAPIKLSSLAAYDPGRANAYAKSVLVGFGRNKPALLNQLAWTMVDPTTPLAGVDVSIATRMASRAVAGSQRDSVQQAQAYDTLALTEARLHHFSRAAAHERKAMEIFRKRNPRDTGSLGKMAARLASYSRKRHSR